MLTGADTDADTILGLDSGANDYVTKPFQLGVLLARIRAQLRQHEQSEDAVIHHRALQLPPEREDCWSNAGSNKKIRLTEKETSILKYLYRAGDRPIGRETLLGEVWGYNAGVTTHTLETHIYRLRQKIERDPIPCRDPGDGAGRLSAGFVTAVTGHFVASPIMPSPNLARISTDRPGAFGAGRQ